jgi:hypothetical protein
MSRALALLGLFPVVALVVGCSNGSNDSEPLASGSASSPAATRLGQAPACCTFPMEGTRPKGPSVASGIPQIVEIVKGQYHAEIVLEKKGVLRLHTLGKNTAQVQEVDLQKIEAAARVEDFKGSTPLPFEAAPVPEDSKGKTSRFVAKLPQPLRGKTLFITVPITINSQRYRFSFALAQDPHDDDGMPLKIVDEEERKLYLTPGGKYTQADIEANGKLTASQKYDVSGWIHDLRPKVGEALCPITLTKANPACTWIVGGKKYSFCCPPCIDSFVEIAKTQPDQIKDPDAYRKK